MGFPLLILTMGYVFLVVAAWAAYGIYRMVRSSERSRRYLAAAKNDQPLQIEHLSLDLQRLAEETRLLRISLEAPIRDIADYRSGEFAHTASEDLDGFDNMLMDVSRQLRDWVVAVERLPELERNTLSDLGLSEAPIRAALDAEGGAFERRFVNRAGQPPMEQRLGRIVTELGRMEASLQTAGRLYR